MGHWHPVGAAELDDQQLEHRRRAHGLLLAILMPLWLGAVLVVAFTMHLGSLGDVTSPMTSDAADITTLSGEVLEVEATTSYAQAAAAAGDGESYSGPPGAMDRRPAGEMRVALDPDETPDGADEVTLQVQPATMDAGVEVGDRVLVTSMVFEDDSVGYSFAGFDSSALLLTLVALFVLVLLLAAGSKGLRALLGLGVSVGLMWTYTFPALVSGAPALMVALATGVLVLTVVMYTTHGFSARTTTALLGTLAGTALAAGLGLLALSWGNLTGIGDEDDLLLWASAPELSMSHLVLCAVVITAIGVLNDVTITQSSAVWELARDGRSSSKGIFSSALRIGRDHIASSVYTLVFVAVGASVATHILLLTYDRSPLQLLGTESFTLEIITTLIGAIAVISAMPVTTALAVGAARTSLPATSPLKPEE